MYKEREWCTSKYIHRLEPKAQWTKYNINTSHDEGSGKGNRMYYWSGGAVQ